jgi:hypothetical protein
VRCECAHPMLLVTRERELRDFDVGSDSARTRQYHRRMRIVERLLALVLCSLIADGCGSVASNQTDASPNQDSLSGATRQCDAMDPFSEPMPLAELANTGAITASLSQDERTIYTWGKIGASTTSDIYTATRPNGGAPFGDLAPLPNVNSDSDEADPWISSDGNMLLFTSGRDGNVDHLYGAQRASGLTEFQMPEAIAGIGATSASADRCAFITADGSELWFVSNRDSINEPPTVWRAVAAGVGFASPAEVGAVSSKLGDLYPMLSNDKLTIYVSSLRSGKGNFDVWRAHRSTDSDGFGTPFLVSELNTDSDERATWLSPDGCRIYLRSNRGDGVDRIYVATRLPR